MSASNINALMLSLSELGDQVCKLTDGLINWGGCGVFASALADRLTDLGYHCRIAIAGGDSPAKVRQRIKGGAGVPSPERWRNGGLVVVHAYVRFKDGDKWYLADAEGVMEDSPNAEYHGHPIHPASMSMREFRKLAEAKRMWNTAFPRDNLIRPVRKLVGEFSLPAATG